MSNSVLNGAVTDPTGASIAGVQVTVKSPDTGLTQTTATSAAGTYTFPILPPGTYTVTAR